MSVFKQSVWSHHKLLRLCDRLGKAGWFHLCRLWTHCEDIQRGDTWPNANPDYVENVALWDGEPGRLYKTLVDLHWIDELPDGGVRIHGWAEANRTMRSAWRAWKIHKSRSNESNDTRPSVVRQSNDTRPSVVRQSNDTPPTIGRPSDGSRPTPILSYPSVHLDQSTSFGGTGGTSPPGPPKPSLRKGRSSKRQLRADAAACRDVIKRLSGDEESGDLAPAEAKLLAGARKRLAEIQEEQIHGK